MFDFEMKMFNGFDTFPCRSTYHLDCDDINRIDMHRSLFFDVSHLVNEFKVSSDEFMRNEMSLNLLGQIF